MRKSVLGLLIVLGPFVALGVLYQLTTSPIDNSRPLDIPQTGPITIALAGDMLITDPLGAAERDQGFVAARSAVRGSTFALANLEMNLRDASDAPPSGAESSSRWPWGGARQAEFLRELGFDAVTLANDHAADYGVDAVLSTRRVLDAAGILHAGTGEDLAQARAPLIAGRIAVLGVAVSSMPDARATASRGEIKGRAGVNPLRYTADITVDATTFRTLSDSAPANAGAQAGENALRMAGATIKKGERTGVDFVADPADEREILDAIRAARRDVGVVIVSVHAHEPSNASDEPAPLVQHFARAAIDAGASIVVGHGPHRLRGVEAYGAGVILYSLGNFFYQPLRVDFRAANTFDLGVNLFQAAVGAGGTPEAQSLPPNDPSWWHSALAVATVDSRGVTGLTLIPLDLGADKSLETRGIPRVVDAEGSGALEHVRGLSRSFGTEVALAPDSRQILVRLAPP
jgi:poly-gamma-glutamate synthesis protein (capsule biosynthesis protein)